MSADTEPSPPWSADRSSAPGESAFEAVAELLSRQAGLILGPTAKHRLVRHLRAEADRLGIGLDAYVGRLPDDTVAWQELVNQITVQETSFFRDPGQYEVLARHILPRLRRPVQIWSAGCAFGQEPYSLAMILAEAGVSDWRVFGSDISTAALEKATSGRYRERELRGLSTEHRNRWLQAAGNDWIVRPELRERVTFLRHNLHGGPPSFEVAGCQVVFCRNVLIYFDRERWSSFLSKLGSWLEPGSYLFLGAAESLWDISDLFEPVHLDPRTIHRRRDLSRTTGGPPEPVPGPEPALNPKPAKAPEPRPVPAPMAEIAEVRELLSKGEEAFVREDYRAAVTAFRKAIYLDPDHPIAHLHQGICFEAMGDREAARRAYSAALAALTRGGRGAIEVALEGYALNEAMELLEAKLAEVVG